MKIKEIILGILFLLFILPIVAQVVVIPISETTEMINGKSYYVHTVQKGQTIYSIAKAYDVTPDEIYFENPGSKQGIIVNQILLIRTINKETELKEEVVATNFDFFYHIVGKNETFRQIGLIYSIPEKYLLKANAGLHDPLREGEYVKVPVKEAFDILDGKIPVKPVTFTESTTGNNDITNNKTAQKPQRKAVVETVSFNPDIPVLHDYRHIVVSGETTHSIAKKYNIPVDILKAVNPGLGNTVVEGYRLRIPDKAKLDLISGKQSDIGKATETQNISEKNNVSNPIPTAQKPETIKHKVKRKETLYSIGREYGVTVAELFEANKGLTTTISVGQIIIVPRKSISKPYILYKVENNTKINKLAKLYRIPAYQIKEINPKLEKRIYQNQIVKIPVGHMANIVTEVNEDDNKIVEYEKTDDFTENTETHIGEYNFSPDNNKVFKVALMIPLFLEEADSLNREEFLLSRHNSFIPFRFIQFYEGAMIALDSITKQGMKVKLFVYDVDKNITKTAKVLKRRELQSMNLIIGPFYSTSFNQVALFAGNFNIPIVNPLSYREAVVNNYSTVIKAKPGTLAQTGMIETFINSFSNNSKVFLISQTSYIDADKVIEINNGILSVLKPQIKLSNKDLFDLSYQVAERDTLFDVTTTPPPYIIEGTEVYPEILESNITDSTVFNNYLTRINYATDSLHPFLENASPLRNNLVILYGTKKSFILDVLNRLNESRDTFDITLVGMPTWERISNLNNVKMNNLNLSYFSSAYINYNSESTQDFIYTYRNRYNNEPGSYAFTGFDLTYYFLSALYYLGDDFNKYLDLFPMKLLQSKYYFNRVANTNNFENNYWNMIQIKRMTRTKIPDSIILPDIKETYNE